MGSPDPGADQPTRTGSQAAADLAPGTVLASRFAIEGILGVGGMGVVYRARDTALDVPVALKLLRPELAGRQESFERFRQELLLARQVSSPHVVRIHDIAVDDGRWFISMDLVDGEPLDRRLDREGALPVDTALAIARQVALGLQAAHASGVVHRDLKPSNVLVDAAGNARISDFGVARSLGTEGMTRSGTIVGTPDYLSPEQARGAPVDGRSDLYALGLMLYEMIAGHAAFTDGTAAESLARRLVQSPPRLDGVRRDVPAWVARLVDRLTQPRPARRLPDAAAVVAAIDARSMPRDLRPDPRGLAVAALLAGAVALAAWWRLAPSPVPPPVAEARLPPDRIVLVAEEAAGSIPRLSGIAEMLRLGWSLQPAATPVVDAERTELARVQAGFSESRPATDAELLAILPARHVLRLAIEGSGEHARLVARFSTPPGPPSTHEQAVAGDLPAAALRLAESLRQPLGVGPLPADVVPASDDVLSVYSDALSLRLQGRMEDAAAAFTQLAESAPGFAPAWLGLAETADLAGQRPLALDAARRGQALGGALAPVFADLLERHEGDPGAALASQRRRVASREDDLDARLVLADLELDHGEFEAAIADLDALLERDPQDPRAWFLLGKASILHGEPRQAVEDHLVRALVLYKRGRSLLGEAETTNALGVGYARLGQTADAEEQYRKAVELRRALGDRRGVASSLRNLAQVAMIRGRFEEAQASLDEARALFAALGDDDGGAAVDNELGLLAEERGQYAAALVAYKRALRAREIAGDPQGIAETLNNIGFAHYQLGDYDNARVFWRQARDAFQSLDDHNGLVRADQNLGLLDIARGDWDTARKVLEGSLREAQSRHMHEEAAVSRRNLAELDLLQSRLPAALAHLEQARVLFTDRGDQRGRVDADLLMARLLASAGNADAATALLDRIGPDLDASSSEQRAIAALQRAEMLLDAGRDADARRIASDALALAGEAGVQALGLQARLLGLGPDEDDAAAALDRDIAALGNLPLQLRWLEQRAALALARGDAAAATAAWHEATTLLGRRPDYLRAASLHALGARALASTGAAEQARAAQAEADAARTRLRQDLPAELLVPPDSAVAGPVDDVPA